MPDLLPAGLEYVSNSTASGSYISGTGVWDIGSVASGTVATLTITAKVTSASGISNFAEVTASDQTDPDSTVNNDGGAKTANEDDEASALVDAQQIDLSLAKTVSNTTPDVGDRVVFTLSVTVIISSDGP